MANPALPPGFVLEKNPKAGVAVPPLPPGFTLEQREEPRRRTFGEEASRQLGLAGRSIVEGVGGLAALPSDALFGLVNFIQAQRGEPMPFKLASESISEGLTRAGVPVPETTTERVAGTIQNALAGSAGTIGLGRQLAAQAAPRIEGAIRGSQVFQAPALSSPAARSARELALVTAPPRAPLSQAAGELLAAAPGAQAGGAIGASTAQQAAAALGAPLPVQMAASLAGGAAAGGGMSAGAAARRGGAGLFEPMTESGRRAIAGNILQEAATDPAIAIANLENTRQVVPGSAPTTGQAARDTGLAYFEQRLQALGDPRFQQRSSQQNRARQALLDSVADGGLPEKIQQRVALREQVTKGQRDRAFTEAAGKRVATENVLNDIDALLALPENAGVSTQQALGTVRKWLVREGRPQEVEGMVVQESQPITDAQALYAVRKEINRILEGRFVNADESVLRYAGGQLARVRESIDNAISEVAPSWKQYLTKYAQLSRPIDRAEILQSIRQKTALAAPDISTGRDFISQAKWRNVVALSMPELRESLTKGQITKLRRITEDLDNGAAAAAAGKMKGSDTAANLAMSGRISVANVVARVMGTPAKQLPAGWGNIARPLSFLYNLPDESIRQMLVDAMLDPKLAEQLLKEGSPQNVRQFVEDFARSTQAATQGAAAGQVGSQ